LCRPRKTRDSWWGGGNPPPNPTNFPSVFLKGAGGAAFSPGGGGKNPGGKKTGGFKTGGEKKKKNNEGGKWNAQRGFVSGERVLLGPGAANALFFLWARCWPGKKNFPLLCSDFVFLRGPFPGKGKRGFRARPGEKKKGIWGGKAGGGRVKFFAKQAAKRGGFFFC